MDPTTCYLEMLQAEIDNDLVTARERAEALRNWLQKGGFYPVGFPPSEVETSLTNILRRTAHLE